MKRIEDWPPRQRPIPNRSEAVRTLVEIALEHLDDMSSDLAKIPRKNASDGRGNSDTSSLAPEGDRPLVSSPSPICDHERGRTFGISPAPLTMSRAATISKKTKHLSALGKIGPLPGVCCGLDSELPQRKIAPSRHLLVLECQALSRAHAQNWLHASNKD